MFDRLISMVDRIPLWLIGPAGVALVGVIGLTDYLTGAQLSFSVFFLLPIALVAWRAGRVWSFGFSAVSAVVWYATNLPGSLALGYTHATLLWNAVTRLGFFVIVASLICSSRRLLDRERELAGTDSLTGLLNRRAFYQAASRELDRARRYAHPISMIYLDLDDFKALNDRHGHSAGDQALEAVAGLLVANVRLSDSVARLGGDEFCVLLPEASADSAQAAAAKLQRVLGEGLTEYRPNWPAKLSMGVVTYQLPPGTIDELIKKADELMYEAKRAGKAGLVHQVIQSQAEVE